MGGMFWYLCCIVDVEICEIVLSNKVMCLPCVPCAIMAQSCARHAERMRSGPHPPSHHTTHPTHYPSLPPFPPLISSRPPTNNYNFINKNTTLLPFLSLHLAQVLHIRPLRTLHANLNAFCQFLTWFIIWVKILCF